VQRTRIKICGITRVEDALAAARAGADAIGMVFYKPAPRCITMDRARAILAALPPFVTPVGVFVDADASEILEITDALGLRHVQLNGNETAESVAELSGCVVLKAIRVDRATFATQIAGWRNALAAGGLPNLRGIVLESATKAPGGTGVENDWDFIAEFQRSGGFADLPSIIAAGGLNPQNVARVVRALRPWAVDVSSGVEQKPGEKSSQKIEAFVAEVSKADQTPN
jgi:phosphoribosylanthranilate isomerase